MNLIILGAPGAGKGTQAVYIAKHYDITHISTGQFLRDEMKDGTEVGKQITHLMEKGQLVPDEIVLKILDEQLFVCEKAKGFILDGFPRTLKQAEILETMPHKIDAVIKVEVSDDVIVERISGRQICTKCSETFHKFYHHTIKPNICDVCGSPLMQREDDKTATVLNRLQIYHELTEPIVNYYDKKGLLFTVSGIGEVDEIFEQINEKLINFTKK